jgi:hypothetical protein
MYIAIVPNRHSRPAVLLRESYREEGKVKNRTLANLSTWSLPQVETLRHVLKGEPLVAPSEAFEVVRSLPHGHVAAVLGMVRQLQMERLLAPQACQERQLVVAMLVARILAPGSKLALARSLAQETKTSTLGTCLGVTDADEEALYTALDWLGTRQEAIERQLATRHLQEGSLVLCDVTSTYVEGCHCPVARIGYSRDGKKGTWQIIFGLLCDRAGRPVAVEVFAGNTADPKTVAVQVAKVRNRFGVQRVVWVGDRGLLTAARIQEDLAPIAGLEWITTLRTPALQELADEGVLSLALFAGRDYAEVTHAAYPGERLIACRNPLLAAERARKRDDLLHATEQELETIVAATRRARRPLQGQDQIGLRVGKVLGRYKVGKHFHLTITANSFAYQRDEIAIQHEAGLDGLYVIRTNVPAAVMTAAEVVAVYKGLAVVERAFRRFKLTDLEVRPIYHRLEKRVRSHIFLCMLAYYVEWHMRQALAPLLFDDDDPAAAAAARHSIVSPAQRSDKAHRKASTQRTEAGYPVHSFHTLLNDLATLTQNEVVAKAAQRTFIQLTRPTPVQQKAFDLLGVKLQM